MASTTYPAFLRSVQDLPGGVFFLYGDEEFLREEAVDRVVERHLDPATRDFNFDQLRGDGVSPEALASVLATPPMMAEWRVVVIRDAQGLSVKAREVLLEIASRPPPGLALIVSAAIPAGSKAKFYTDLQRAARSAEFAPVEPLDAPGWLIEQSRTAHEKEMDVDAARALVSALGTGLGALSSELSKLAAYVQERQRITLDDVRAVSGSIPRYDRWAWFDLVGERRIGEALKLLPVLLQGGENGVGLIIGLSSQLLRIGLVCAGGNAALERELKPYQRWMAKRVTPQARRWTLAEVDTAIAELLRTDRLLKSASLTDQQAMEELLLRLQSLTSTRDRAA